MKRILKGYSATATASTITTGSFKNVNNQKAVGILPVNKDGVNFGDCKLTIYVNGVSIITKVDLINFSAVSKDLNKILVLIPENALITYELNNSVGSDIDVDFILMYSDVLEGCKKYGRINDLNNLIEKTETITATAGGSTSYNFSALVGRGDISSLFVSKENGTFAVSSEDKIDIIADGVYIYENITGAIAFVGLASIGGVKLPVKIKEGASIEIIVTNNGGSPKDYYFNFGYNGN
jgi:hypothetical protein